MDYAHTVRLSSVSFSPNGVGADVFKEVVTLRIIIEVDGSVGVSVMSREKVGDGASWDSQGPQHCVCVYVCWMGGRDVGVREKRNHN